MTNAELKISGKIIECTFRNDLCSGKQKYIVKWMMKRS